MTKMPTKVVILGSTGFVGTALLAHLRQQSNILVEGYSSSNLNLTCEDCVDRLCQVVDAETVLIVAARSRQTESEFQSFSDSIAIDTSVARFLSERPVKKCLYFSTISVYGDAATNLSVAEDTAIAPTSLYGIAKFAGECLIRQVAEKNKVPLVIFRPCKIYGPGDPSNEYGPTRFSKSILLEGKVRLFGDGTELRDHLFIRDLVEIIRQFILGNQQGTYNLATGQSHSFQEIVGYLRKIAQRDFAVIQLGRDRPKVDQRINPAKLLGSLKDFRFINIESGLAGTYRYFSETLSGG